MATYRMLAFAIFIVLLAGCETVPEVDNLKYPLGQVSLYGPDEKKIVYENEIEKGADYEIGLSLSGGGIRSSSFSIGALAGLNDAGILKKIDVISTVSGGGYAGYWYLSNLYHSALKGIEVDVDLLFNDCYPTEFRLYEGTKNQFYQDCKDNSDRLNNDYRFQNQLTQQSDLLYYYQDGGYGIYQAGEAVAKILYHGVSIIPHHVGGTLFDWGWNVSGIEGTYQNGIERTFGLVPVDLHGGIDQKEYLNSKSILHMDNARAQPFEFKGLSKYMIENWKGCDIDNRNRGTCTRAPLWIINATAGVANKVYSWIDNVPPLSKTVFEITPFGYGSGEYGYVSEPFSQFGVSKAVAVSGAAADNQFESDDLKGFKRLGTSLIVHSLNLGMGESIYNYNPEGSSYGLHASLPWPFYYFHGFNRNRDSADIYLSDGGHSENLGAYSLIVRGVKNVIIVDSEHDENGTFQALRRLQNRLKKEHGLILEFTDLPEEIDTQDVAENIYVGRVKNYRKGYVSDDDKEITEINVVYVKSGIIKELMSPDCSSNDDLYPCSVYKHYSYMNLKRDGKGGCEISDNSDLFPHHSTVNTAFEMSVDIYYAYRDFSRFILNRLYMDDGIVKVREKTKFPIPVSPAKC